VVPRSKQPRRSQAAEETRRPQSGRAQEGERAPTRKLPRSADRECRASAFAIRGIVLDAAASLFADRAHNLVQRLISNLKPTTEQLAGSRPLACSSHSGIEPTDTPRVAWLGFWRYPRPAISSVLQRAI
jgi:hypothetical protein